MKKCNICNKDVNLTSCYYVFYPYGLDNITRACPECGALLLISQTWYRIERHSGWSSMVQVIVQNGRFLDVSQ